MKAIDLPQTHSSIDARSWVELIEGIEKYEASRGLTPGSYRNVSCEIARDILRVARKAGVQSYSETEVIEATFNELQGPLFSANVTDDSRNGLFEELANIPGFEVLEIEDERYIRPKLGGSKEGAGND